MTFLHTEGVVLLTVLLSLGDAAFSSRGSSGSWQHQDTCWGLTNTFGLNLPGNPPKNQV